MTDSFELENYPTLHGPIARLAEWYYQCSTPRLRSTAYFTALVTCCNLCSRFYEFHDTFSSLYFMLIGDTGIGKNNIVQLPDALFSDAGLDDFIMPKSNFTGDSGLYSALIEYPQSMCLIDEAGFILEGFDDSTIAKTIKPLMLSIYSSTKGKIKPKSFSSLSAGKDLLSKPIFRPAFTFAGVTTPVAIKKIILNPATWESGQNPRFIYWCVERPEECPPSGTYHKADDQLLSQLRRIIAHGNKQAAAKAMGIYLPIKPMDAEKVQDNNTIIHCELEEGPLTTESIRRDAYDEATHYIKIQDNILKGLSSRKAENIFRLAIPLSLMSEWDVNLDKPVITQQALKDATDIFNQSMNTISSFIERQPAYPDRIISIGNKIRDAVLDAGGASITRFDIKRKGIKVSSPDWKLIEDYLEDESVEIKSDPSCKGRPVKRYSLAVD